MKKSDTRSAIVLVILVIISALGANFIITYSILFYEYGIMETFNKGIHLVEMKPQWITSEGDTLNKYYRIFHFLFMIVPFTFLLVTLFSIYRYFTGELKLDETEEKKEVLLSDENK